MKTETKNCQNCKQNFIIESEDFNFYEKMKVPAPTFCPTCRMQRRFAWRNERTFHRNKCSFSGKDLISGFSPNSGIIVYDRDIWWSDQWDPMSYGIKYDFSKPFFSQFNELIHKAPMPAVFNARTVNTPYAQHTGDFKNGYLVVASWGGENVSYGARVNEVRDSMDVFVLTDSELCYEVIAGSKCYRVFFSENVEACNDSAFLFECKGCSSCFGCTNLRNKSYCIFNKQYSREEYLEKIKELDLGNRSNLKEISDKFSEFKAESIRKFANITNSPLSTGDNIVNSYNCKECFDLYGEIRDCKFVQNVAKNMKDTYDGYGVGASAELMYEVFDSGAQGSRFFVGGVIYGGPDIYYSYNCHGCSDCFGCVGLRQKQYCIFNRQFTKEEYQKLFPKIVQHMNDMPYVDKKGRVYKYGEFFPIELSPFSYNETIAQEYLPLTREEVEKEKYSWKVPEKREFKIDIKINDLPNNIKDAEDSIVGKVVECMHVGKCNEKCTEAFKITDNELKFYKRMNLALPVLCPNCRHYQRLKQRNPLNLWHRSCMCDKTNHFHAEGKCEIEFETPYAPDRTEIVYCEKCYQAEVY